MEEQERVASQVFERKSGDIPGAREPRMRVPYAPFGLEAPRPQPLVREGETLTAMVVLPVLDPHRASVLQHRAVPRHTVRDTREELRQVERSVGVMPDPEKEHLPVQIVHPTYGAFGDVGRKRERVGRDPGSFRPDRREGVDVIASQYTGQSPEHVRHDSEARRCWSGHRVEGSVVIPRPGRHHQSAVGSDGSTESPDQAERSALHRPGSPEGRVYQQDAPLLDAEGTELIGHLGSAHLIPLGPAPQHPCPHFIA